jgi:Uma2 family endonuclease
MTAVNSALVLPRTLAEHYAAEHHDGLKRELVDGTLIVSPGPQPRHAYACSRLATMLDAECPTTLTVLSSPTNVDEEPATNVDRRPTDFRPLLVAEVLSPSSRRLDTVFKRAIYQRMGLPSYWLIDPDEPSLLVLELDGDGGYREVASGGPGDVVELTSPYPVTVEVDRLTIPTND